MNRQQTKKQKGFTLVELAVVMVIIGILLSAILRGQTLIDNARGKNVLAEVKAMEALAWTFYDRKGRFPGDCDENGLIGIDITIPGAGLTAPVVADTLDGAVADPNTLDCLAVAVDNKDSAIADLRVEFLLDYDATRSNASIGTHSMGGQMTMGTIDDGTTSRNAIVFYDVPQWIGEMVDANIDGTVAGDAGRIRYFDSTITGDAWEAKQDPQLDAAFYYLFDKNL